MSLVVVKCGGAVAAVAAAGVRGLVDEGNQVCVVHGAGPQISAEMERLGLAVRFIHGRRVTEAAALAVVRESLAGVNAGSARRSGRTPSASWATRSASKREGSPSSASSVSRYRAAPQLCLQRSLRGGSR